VIDTNLQTGPQAADRANLELFPTEVHSGVGDKTMRFEDRDRANGFIQRTKANDFKDLMATAM
jgi:hypothetical protein